MTVEAEGVPAVSSAAAVVAGPRASGAGGEKGSEAGSRLSTRWSGTGRRPRSCECIQQPILVPGRAYFFPPSLVLFYPMMVRSSRLASSTLLLSFLCCINIIRLL